MYWFLFDYGKFSIIDCRSNVLHQQRFLYRHFEAVAYEITNFIIRSEIFYLCRKVKGLNSKDFLKVNLIQILKCNSYFLRMLGKKRVHVLNYFYHPETV